MEAVNKKFHSIFPYFKQLMPSDGDSKSESLPNDLSQIDQQKTYSGLEMIGESELSKLHISKEITMTNYRQLVSQQLNAQNNGEAFWFILDGNLEAGLVLIDEIGDQVEGYLKEEIVVCVPSRDVILATAKSNEPVIADFTEKAKQILTNGNHSLSKNWFIRENKQWNVFRKMID